MRKLRSWAKNGLPNGIHNAVNTTVLTVLIAILLLGGYSMYDSYYVYALSESSSILYTTTAERQDALVRDYPASVAWLYIEDTVDEPLMQGSNNTEYLNKAPDGTYSLRGSLFIDSRNTNDFSDDYTLIYGHHMSFYQMFGALDHYLCEPAYWTDEHIHGTILLKDEREMPFTIFAAGSVDASVKEIFEPTEKDIESIISYITSADDFVYNNVKDAYDLKDKRIVCFSTCQSPESTLRTCVLAILDEE